MRTLIVSSLGQLADSVAGTGQVESGLAADMTHWPEDSEKVNEVQLPPGDLKQFKQPGQPIDHAQPAELSQAKPVTVRDPHKR